MHTVEIWAVIIESLAEGDRSWVRRFVGEPTRRNIRDALTAEQADPHVAVDIFIDLFDRLPNYYVSLAQTPEGVPIRAAGVPIGTFLLRKEIAYIPED